MSKKKEGTPADEPEVQTGAPVDDPEVQAAAPVAQTMSGVMTAEVAIARGLDPVPFGGNPE